MACTVTKQLHFATWLRVAGMVSILLCHFVQQSWNPYLNMSAQFFNIGVELFIILSGFLFGIRGGNRCRNLVQKTIKAYLCTL